MKPLETILDTNVLIASLRSGRGASFELLRLVGDERWRLHLSTALLLEYELAVSANVRFWFSPERLALQALVNESQRHVTGAVRVKLYKGNIMVTGRKSPVSLYNPHIARMEADPSKAYNQDDATGFIRLNALRLKVAAKVQKKR